MILLHSHVTKQLYLDEDFDELDNYVLYWFFVDEIMNHVIIDIIMDNIQQNIDLLYLFHLFHLLLIEELNPIVFRIKLDFQNKIQFLQQLV
jgi:hypothetical protein